MIEHDERGRGTIRFERKQDAEAITDPLEVSADALARIKGLYDALRFLDSDANYQGKREYPSYGKTVLRLASGGRERAAARERALAARRARKSQSAEAAAAANEADAARTALVKKLVEVEDMLRVRNYEGAEARLRALLQDYPGEPRVFYALGEATMQQARETTDDQLQLERLNRALAHYRMAVTAPTSASDPVVLSRSHAAMGRILAFMDQPEAAMKEFDAAIKLGRVPGGAYDEAVAAKQKLAAQQQTSIKKIRRADDSPKSSALLIFIFGHSLKAPSVLQAYATSQAVRA